MSNKLGSLPVGSIVKLKYKNQPTDFIVIYQGLPSGYDTSCRGTWVLSRNALLSDVDFDRYNAYAVNIIDAQIRGILDKVHLDLDASIRPRVKEVDLPCIVWKSGHEAQTRSRGLSAHAFLLNEAETQFDCFRRDNSLLRCKGTNGQYGRWWLRDPYYKVDAYKNGYVMMVNENGSYIMGSHRSSSNVRAAMVLDPELSVDSNNNVTTNQPPIAPNTINLPSTIKGGASCSVSWSASNDPDNNLEGYIVERSYNGGSSWSQIYQGSATSTSTTIPHGTSTVMFRVCAYDTNGERSGWRTSSNKTVVNNRAPNAPSAINVPVKPQGGSSITVTWSAASDPDGNLEGYRLERQWDGKGSWSQIYRGSNLSYSDSIPKGQHTSVAYRVQAHDAFGDTSGYTTSPVRTISNNTAPAIQCELSGDLGDKSEGFTIPYTVTDVENQAVTVTEKVGGMVKRTYQVTLGQSNTFQITGAFFQKVLNGKQTAEIIATDAEGASSTLALTFTKKVHKAVIMLSEPLAVEKQISVCIIKVLGAIPEDAAFKVEVTNNAGDDAPAWEDATEDAKLSRNHVFKNKTQTNGWKFAFRVTAERGKSKKAGYITSVQGGFQ